MTASTIPFRRPGQEPSAPRCLMSNADLLERNAIRLGARTGAPMEILPRRRRSWAGLWFAAALLACAAMVIGAVIEGARS